MLIAMEGISKYLGVGGGSSQRKFKQDAKVVYNKMLRDPQDHLMVGFGQWEFISLLGSRLSGEARTAFFNFLKLGTSRTTITIAVAQDAERRRQLWREY